MIRLIPFLLLLPALAPAQDEDPAAEYARVFQEGIDALEARRLDEGIQAFSRCLELRPEDATCAYNIACGYSLKEELDPAFEWLGKAVDWGFGNSTDNIEHAATKDGDLENLRGDARFAALIEKMRTRLAALEEEIAEYTKTAAIHVPEALQDAESVGALVVLHDAGSTKDDVLDSFWKDAAAELELALVAPSGTTLAGKDPADGMAWFSDFEAFQKRYWDAEATIQPALEQLGEHKTVDPARTLIAGEGQGGLIAFNAAMRAPRKFRGVVAVDAPILPPMVQAYLSAASGAGSKVRLVANQEAMFGVPPAQIGTVLSQASMALRQAKVDVGTERYRLDPEKPDLRGELVLGALRQVLDVVEAVEAGSDK